MQERLEAFKQALLSTNAVEARRLLADGEAADVDAPRGLNAVEQLVVPALAALGDAWASGEASLSQIYLGGHLCESLVDEILPPTSSERIEQPRMAIATFEDYHLLGKRIVYSVLRSSGYELKDYGRVDADQVVDLVNDDRIEVLLLSVLMLPSALSIAQLRPRLGNDVKIVVGGAPFRFDPELWRQVGADAMGEAATDAPALVSRFATEMR